MDQEDILDFKALRAKFQEEELPLKQPRIKPALPGKPKVVPPPQSPTHYVPAGARPSLLTSINQSLEARTLSAPRVVFKDDKKESKKPLIKTNSKRKEKSAEKLKTGKDKQDENLSDQKEKKENGKDKKFPFMMAQKESTAELVPATPPPKVTTQKKKGFLGFIKSSKKETVVIPADPILDAPSEDDPGPAPLIPVPTDVGNTPFNPEILEPQALLPKNILFPDASAAVDTTPSSPIPDPPDFNPPPAIFSDILAPQVPTPLSETPHSETPHSETPRSETPRSETPRSETPHSETPRSETPQSDAPLEIENPALPVSRPASQNEITPTPPRSVPTPPLRSAISDLPPVVSAPFPSLLEPEIATEAEAAVEKPPSVASPQFMLPSPKAERQISPLSALERAGDMSTGKKSLADQRILSALEKARRKTTSPLSTPTRSYSISPPPEDPPLSQSPTCALPELPPIDYGERARKALPPTPAQVNGIDHRQASPVLEDIAEEGIEAVPELLNVPPPPPRRAQPALSLDPTPETPDIPPSDDRSGFIPPTSLLEVIPVPPEFSEANTINVAEFGDVASDAYVPELPASEWENEEYTAPDVPDGQDLPEFYRNGINDQGREIHSSPAYEDEYQDTLLPESSLPISQDSPPVEEPEAQYHSSELKSTENIIEDVSPSSNKKKGKSGNGKKRKGTLKNPYAETPPETIQEKTKTGRFGRNEKKAAAEGPDEKELKKKEKQRLEKEKKELKEKQEREKKEQKEREKRENELKKKFKITGQEEAMYQATVTVTTKGNKNDLPVKSGDIISIIRTTNCPKGKWLARDSSNNYGYVAVGHVELDIKEMLELGKKTARKSSSNIIEADVISTGSRASNHFPQSAESYDSEEWACDDDEPVSPAPETTEAVQAMGHVRTLSMPDMGDKDLIINHQHSHSDMTTDGSHVQARHEALQKLATFFHSPEPVEAPAGNVEAETTPPPATEEAVHVFEDSSTQETDFDPSALILPPPDLYADLTLE
ncbi:uncharacterized protein PAE49_016771 isoform 2-T2 [Odontesthes bonariensis]|uniref:uncharacterized protein LOC142400048 isoform X2 n=1 Tax=Odontesthes bonariensis TaxID=219752 RepID=UPI003F582290